jgi:hypothetical protein
VVGNGSDSPDVSDRDEIILPRGTSTFSVDQNWEGDAQSEHLIGASEGQETRSSYTSRNTHHLCHRDSFVSSQIEFHRNPRIDSARRRIGVDRSFAPLPY